MKNRTKELIEQEVFQAKDDITGTDIKLTRDKDGFNLLIEYWSWDYPDAWGSLTESQARELAESILESLNKGLDLTLKRKW